MKFFAPRLPALTLFVLVAALCLTSATPPARAQAQREQGERSLTHTNEGRVNELPDRSKRYALIIGVDQYNTDRNITPLPGAKNDALQLAEALKKYADFPEENIMVLTSSGEKETPRPEPTRMGILNALRHLTKYAQKNSMIVVAFSGHGVERDGIAYLMPADAVSDKDLFADSALRLSSLTDAIKRTGASQVLFLLDACRNDPLAGGRGDIENQFKESFVKDIDFRKQNEGVEAFVTLYAAKVGQRAFEDTTHKQGYFSRAVVEGLAGKAADEQTGLVTLQRLVNYVEQRVPDLVQKEKGKVQTPWASISGFKADQLVLSKTAPTKPLPAVAVAPVPVAPPAPKVGGLSVFSTPGARLTVSAAAGDFNKTLPVGPDPLSLGELKPGDYKLVAELDGHARKEQTVKVTAGDKQPVVLTLEPLTHSVTVKTNVAAGKVEYGVKGEKELRLAELKGGQATIPGLRHGAEYVFKVLPEEGVYVARSESRLLKADAVVDIKLESRAAAQQVEVDFSPEQWAAPASWKFSTKPQGVQVNGAGLALLREESTGRFADFEIVSNVKLVGPTGVSFVLRAIDERNYYLVRLTGDKGEPANKLQFFLYKDGREQRISNLISLSAFNLTEDFEVRIQAAGNRFGVTIVDVNGRPNPAGQFVDERNTFTAGAVGLGAKAGDAASVQRLLVCPGRCQ